MVDYKAPFVLKRDFTPNFPLRLMHKDIRLALEAAKEVRVKLPALETVEEVYEMATEDGHAESGLRRDPHPAGKVGRSRSKRGLGVITRAACVAAGDSPALHKRRKHLSQ